ncbi:HAMP domain-containing protein [Sphingomonas sabuli]|uniref:histidine kinase n=1 Tax=Sphingomonas sabuli TaxID=2764186 RepID=A0A7G9L3J3_9SPHN|nr:ATP-binding protein [Sphingomonas sabuli]QNM83192.1 HAMP domain-containing protein [Sphingomonas sabuli]
MDAPAAESQLTVPKRVRWLERERESGRFYRIAALATALVLLATAVFSFWMLRRPANPGTLLSPPLIAALLIANLIPAIVLMVLMSRRIAMRRAERGGLGSGQLHTRLVALFSVIAAVPTVLVAIFASLLFQSGLEFWFSDRARSMLENSVQVASGSYRYGLASVADEATTMAGDVARYLQQTTREDPRFQEAFGYQVYNRSLNEAAILQVSESGDVQSLALVNAYDGMVDPVRIRTAAAELQKEDAPDSIDARTPDRLSVLTPLEGSKDTYLYAAKWVDPELGAQVLRANRVLDDYRVLQSRSRTNQLQFNAALLLGSLIIVALAIAAALRLADRLVRPVGQLVTAAGKIEEGDFSVRVPVTETEDEIEMLGHAFNRMTARIDEQTGALRTANTQLETRRAFIEAVLSSVTAGVVALDADSRILLINRSAEALLQRGEGALDGVALQDLAVELAEFLHGDEREANVEVDVGGGRRTLAVKRVRYQDGVVLTFDDITDQLSDQRSAAWSDIARRIAHEIKNPLTPIQLAAERLQRRFGGEVESDKETFERLTGTIVRQVGDLRRMVDEFSNFARMPKPVFRAENVHEIARHALFLHEVAHPQVKFVLNPPTGDFPMVCDRRQLAQALTNVVKNAVEAIESRRARGEHHLGGDRVELTMRNESGQLVIDITDTGIGLPEDRERLTEPYMTTRVRGTGLGLAIVKKIVEEHCGEIAFLDRSGGGTHVRIAFDVEALAGADCAPEDDTTSDHTDDEE